jgi:cardiolipin synthase
MTWPNVLTVLRLVLIAVFVVGALLGMSQLFAFVVLFFAGLSDFLDGWLARKLGQESRLGELLDPIADRLLTLVLLIYLLTQRLVPWWLVMVLLARDVIVTVSLAALKRRGVTGVTVTYAGKLATFTLTIGLPLLLVANLLTNQLILGIAWAFIVWGIALYWYSGWQYLISARTKLA